MLNALNENIRSKSIDDLIYHCNVLDSLELDDSAKIQIHAGGAYGDKIQALTRFADVYESLEPRIKRRLVIENDDRLFSLNECLSIHAKAGIPIVFDTFHHKLLNNGEGLAEAVKRASSIRFVVKRAEQYAYDKRNILRLGSMLVQWIKMC